MSTPVLHGWHPAEELPRVDGEGESAYLLVMCEESSAPVVAYFTTGYMENTGRWIAAFGGTKPVTARWWKPLDPIPASLFPEARRRWVLSTGLAFDDSEKEKEQ